MGVCIERGLFRSTIHGLEASLLIFFRTDLSDKGVPIFMCPATAPATRCAAVREIAFRTGALYSQTGV
jgi:hypothetical protein